MVAVVIATLLPAAGASAQVTIGELAPANPPASCTAGEFELVPSGIAKSLYTAPTAGAITSWSTNAAAGIGQMLTFKVYRPQPDGRFQVVASDPRPLAPSVLNTFKVAIPIQAGDLIGDNDDNATLVPNACEFITTDAQDQSLYRKGNFGVGSFFTAGGEEGEGVLEGIEEEVRLNASATILPPRSRN